VHFYQLNFLIQKNFNLMKKVNLKNFLMTLSMALAFLVLGFGQVNGQSSTSTIGTGTSVFAKSGVYALPQGPFINPVAAQTVLMSAMTDIKLNQFPSLTPGSAAFNATLNRYEYLSRIDVLLKGQMTVEQAIVDALKTMAFKGVPANALQILRQDAIALLHA
jgi:hypothetical protein